MSVENPNIAINDDEAELFAKEIERLKSITVMDTLHFVEHKSISVVDL